MAPKNKTESDDAFNEYAINPDFQFYK